ncbi:dihydroflavonal-4-reductase [Penicillium riverlandense]|uniref:dihydroflavonal-4-reductase n=1 Tax=Penicillium riverlandense TaxID=1903569 RepID=UPI00254659B0|nr:dihydroflavonal-4-reductase [Penicillium riverlandense]KAJ5819731.1 dihydroflavonal-4-reductase [Penicillium riverlandense]
MSSPLVFITGSTGFIGSYVALEVLKAGYRVRLSIRDPKQEAVLRARYSEFDQKSVDVSLVPDVTKQEYYDTALKDVDYVFHLASPLPSASGDLKKDYINPAVNGTLAVLRAACAYPQIKKVVVMSSIAATAPVVDKLIYTDMTWNGPREVIPVDTSAIYPDDPYGGFQKYSTSKIVAHQATRDFLKNEKPHYNLITVHPSYVMGESLIQQTAEQLGGVNGMFWMSLQSKLPLFGMAWVHVRDIADAHVKLLQTDLPTGTEIILCGPVIAWEDVISFVRSKYPDLPVNLEPPVNPGKWIVNQEIAEKNLGIQWRSMETIVQEVVNQQLALQSKAAAP